MNFKRDSKILVSIERFMNIVGTRMFKFWLHPNVFFRLSKLYRTFLDDSEVFITFAENILKRIKRTNNNDQRETSKSFINQLLKLANSEDAFSDDEVVGETVLTIIAGNETSATVMSNVVLLLAMHPEVQEKVFAELQMVFKQPDAYIGAEELAELVYLEAVIKETQRVMAVIPVITRTTTGDVELSEAEIVRLLNFRVDEPFFLSFQATASSFQKVAT
jgi:cytochrome P450